MVQYPRRIVGKKWFNLVIRSRGNNKKVHDYSHKYIYDFRLLIVNTSPKLTD